MASSSGRFSSFNYTVTVAGSPGAPASATVSGGFTEVSGLHASGFRGGRQFIVLKRGAVDTGDFFTWLKTARYGVAEPRQLTITVLDGARHRVAAFRLRNARPLKWTGPMLAAKGGGDVAMEELVLSHEGIEPE